MDKRHGLSHSMGCDLKEESEGGHSGGSGGDWRGEGPPGRGDSVCKGSEATRSIRYA